MNWFCLVWVQEEDHITSFFIYFVQSFCLFIISAADGNDDDEYGGQDMRRDGIYLSQYFFELSLEFSPGWWRSTPGTFITIAFPLAICPSHQLQHGSQYRSVIAM